jgi:hypothetical protein
LPRPLDPKRLQVNRDGGGLLALQLSLAGQAGQSRPRRRLIGKLFGRSFPTQLLSRRQPTQIKHMPWDHPAAGAPPILHQAPVRVGRAVLAPFMTSQKDCHEPGFY